MNKCLPVLVMLIAAGPAASASTRITTPVAVSPAPIPGPATAAPAHPCAYCCHFRGGGCCGNCLSRCERAVWYKKMQRIHCRLGGPGWASVAQSRVAGPRIRPFVESRLGEARRHWQRCYQLALADAPQLEGSILVTASVSARGKLTVTHATGVPQLVACTSRALEGLDFGRQALSDDSTQLTLEVKFRPNPWCS